MAHRSSAKVRLRDPSSDHSGTGGNQSLTTGTEPLVSVVVPAYNAESTIEATLRSVLAQTYGHMEVIVVDDGSTDGTAAVVGRVGTEDARVVLHRQRNRGLAGARNAGIALARGEFIAPVDADDTWFPDKIARQIRRARECPEAALVYGWSAYIDAEGALTGEFVAAVFEGHAFPALLHGNFIGNGSAPLISASSLREVGLYDTSLRERQAEGCEDLDLYIRLAERFPIAVVPAFLVGYRVVASSLSSHARQMFAGYRAIAAGTRDRHPTLPCEVVRWGTAQFCLYLAWRSMRSGRFSDLFRYFLAACRHDPLYALGQGLPRMVRQTAMAHLPSRAWCSLSLEELDERARKRLERPWSWFDRRRAEALQRMCPSGHPTAASNRRASAMSAQGWPVGEGPAGAVASYYGQEMAEVFHRTKVIELELNGAPSDIEGLEGYAAAKVLARLDGVPLGYVDMSVANGRCGATDVRSRIVEEHWWPIFRHLLERRLSLPHPADGWDAEALFEAPSSAEEAPRPSVTVAVCTRDRTEDLKSCLDALQRMDYEDLEVLVVDNAPRDDTTERLVREHYPRVKYIREPIPGLNWARNRAIQESRGEVIAYADDDVVADPGWVRAIAGVFAQNEEVVAVTGLVIPHELETDAQVLFEASGGFGRGFERKWYRLGTRGNRHRWQFHGAGQYGTGANMAFRRSLFDEVGLFDPALDVGTVTNGGGDLEMFFRVLKAGHTLVYEPRALVRHRHRRDYERLRAQLRNNGTGLMASWVCAAINYPDERRSLLRIAFWWMKHRYLWGLIRSGSEGRHVPRDLVLAEMGGYLAGLTRYRKARGIAKKLAKEHGRDLSEALPERCIPVDTQEDGSIAVRQVDLDRPLEPLQNLEGYETVRVFAMSEGRPLGHVDIAHPGERVSVGRLRDALVERLGPTLLAPQDRKDAGVLRAEMYAELRRRYVSGEEAAAGQSVRLPRSIPVSVVVATLDRPDDLRECLRCLYSQETSRPVEIVVVDNNPESGLTAPVVAEFPGTVLVNESRRGLAYARNAGFTASTGDIAIATDDDVRVPPGWLERLVAPFARSDVMIVTGHVLPLELETRSQRHFEAYGGLGRGFVRFEVDGKWFDSFRGSAVPTWTLGATANAAFRASIFSHPDIGLMEEALGPGMPSGVGEDTYLFYRTLRAGFRLVYEPSAFVWHRHRREEEALRRQILSYSKGHVAYHLNTVLRDGDMRGLKQVAVHLPAYRIKITAKYFIDRIRRRENLYPLSLIMLEIYGNLIGPWALVKSYLRVRREGRSESYVPVKERTGATGSMGRDSRDVSAGTPNPERPALAVPIGEVR